MKAAQIKTTPVSNFFAYAAENTHGMMNRVNSIKSGFTFAQGIPPMYSSRTGCKVNRLDFNGIGRLITQSKVFNQMGGYFTYISEVSEAIGGYPLGAVLYYKDPISGLVRIVRSLIENNTRNFVENPEFIDNVNWSYVDNIIPVALRPRIFIDASNVIDKDLGISNGKSNGEFDSDCDRFIIFQTGRNYSLPNSLSEPSNMAPLTADGDDSSSESDTPAPFEPVPSENEGILAEATPSVVITVEVRKRGSKTFHAAACLGFLLGNEIPYNIFAESLEPVLMKNTQFTTSYIPSPVGVYLNAGDRIRISASAGNNTISYHFWAFRLVAE